MLFTGWLQELAGREKRPEKIIRHLEKLRLLLIEFPEDNLKVRLFTNIGILSAYIIFFTLYLGRIRTRSRIRFFLAEPDPVNF